MTPTSPASFVVNAKPTHFDPNQPLTGANWISAQLSLAALAKEANLSTYHFAHLFRTSMGEPLHQL